MLLGSVIFSLLITTGGSPESFCTPGPYVVAFPEGSFEPTKEGSEVLDNVIGHAEGCGEDKIFMMLSGTGGNRFASLNEEPFS